MPLNKYDTKDEVSVTMDNGLIYVFETNVDTVERTGLGHVTLPAIVPALAFKGGNSPKPRRARRRTADGWNSSFCAATPATVVTALKTAGWQVGKIPKRRGIITGTTARATTVYVTVRGIKYAWNMTVESLNTMTQATATALGIERATAADIPTLVWGASIPKPAKVQFFNTAGPGNGDFLTTFVGQAQEDNLPAGWKLIAPRIMFPGDP
jgi:hypothetical protein